MHAMLCYAMLRIREGPIAALQAASGRFRSEVLLTFNGVHELVGCIHDLYETTAVAALGHLLSISQHTTCNMQGSVPQMRYKCCCQLLLQLQSLYAHMHGASDADLYDCVMVPAAERIFVQGCLSST